MRAVSGPPAGTGIIPPLAAGPTELARPPEPAEPAPREIQRLRGVLSRVPRRLDAVGLGWLTHRLAPLSVSSSSSLIGSVNVRQQRCEALVQVPHDDKRDGYRGHVRRPPGPASRGDR